jgi:D-3-phosphoglycerate dehydrogenase
MRASGDRVLIASVPFGQVERTPLRMLEDAGVAYAFKPHGRRLTEREVIDLLGDFTVIIAGLDPLTDFVLAHAPGLRLIARLGIGLDTVDLAAAQARSVAVSYTPDAPALAVAELTIGLMLAQLRSIPNADRGIRNGTWPRLVGRRLGDRTVGIVGAGRVGRHVIRHLAGFGPAILAADPRVDRAFGDAYRVRWVERDVLFRDADLISLHVPLTPETRRMITAREIATMRPGAVIVNTSRGELIDEGDLAAALRDGRLGGAALDVFASEPYTGDLAALDNTVLTSHMGSLSSDCRLRMEIEAVDDVLRFLRGEPLQRPAPMPARAPDPA